MTFLPQFRENPVEFARLHPLTVLGPGFAMKEKPFDHGEETITGYQVPGLNRICWFDVDRMRGDPTVLEVGLEANFDEALEPAYWLPWQQNEIIRTTLRPSKKAEGALEGVEPNFFFTAPLTGCSVFVEGPRDQPTVYHANALSHAGTFDTPLRKQAFLELQRTKIEEMEARFRGFSTQHEKLSRGEVRTPPGERARETTMMDYMSRAHRSDFPQDLVEVVRKATNGKFSKIEVAGNKIVVTNIEGTVFGVRDHGEWTFYFQRRVRISHLINDYKGTVGRQTWGRYGFSWFWLPDYWRWWWQSWKVQNEMWLPLTVTEFWPAGGGQIVLRNT